MLIQSALADAPVVLTADTQKLVPILLPDIPAGQTIVLSVTLTLGSQNNFTLDVWAKEPFYRSPISEQPGCTTTGPARHIRATAIGSGDSIAVGDDDQGHEVAS